MFFKNVFKKLNFQLQLQPSEWKICSSGRGLCIFLLWRRLQLQLKIQFFKNIFKEHLKRDQIRFYKDTFIIIMTDRLSNICL